MSSRFNKVTSAPGSPDADSFYAVHDSGGFEAVVTSSGGSECYWQRSGAVVNEYTSGTTSWSKPDGAKVVKVLLIGGGGGGGSGRQGAAATTRCGGGAGAGGAISEWTFVASALPSSVTCTVGSGGTGGSAISSSDTDGQPGTAGGDTLFGAYLIAKGGLPGSGGNSTANLGGIETPGYPPLQLSSNGGNGGGGLNGTGGNTYRSPAGGGGGGYVSNANTVFTGGTAGSVLTNFLIPVTNGNSEQGYGGSGGAGGGASVTANASAGSAGGSYGGGGGGGGGSLNGFNSGAGGSGAPGFIRIVTLF